VISQGHNRGALASSSMWTARSGDQEAMKFYAASDYIVRTLSVVQSRGTEALVFLDFI